MQKYAVTSHVFLLCIHMHLYQIICTKYAKICKISKHEIYMQHMQNYVLPTLLMITQ